MQNDVLLNAISRYLINKEDQSFDVQIVRILVYIYSEADLVNPFLIKDYDLINNNLKRFGLEEESLNKFKKSLQNYLTTQNINDFLTIYKIIIDMIEKKYKDDFITEEEVKKYEEIFFKGRSIKALNDYWNKALYKINNKITFTEVNNNVFNPYAYYLQGKTLADIKEMSDEKLYYLNKKILRDYNIKFDDKNMLNKLNRAIDKAMMPKGALSSGNGFVDILMFLSFVATEIMVGAVIALQMILR